MPYPDALDTHHPRSPEYRGLLNSEPAEVLAGRDACEIAGRIADRLDRHPDDWGIASACELEAIVADLEAVEARMDRLKLGTPKGYRL